MTIYNPKLRKQLVGDAENQAQSLGHTLSPFYRQETQEGDPQRVSAPEHRLVAVCEKCGQLVELPRGHQRALYMECEPDADAAAEGLATLISMAPQLLYNRLAEAAQALPKDFAPLFDPGQFDTQQSYLLSNDGVWCLRFILRSNPYLPISPTNPQSTRGRVEMYQYVADSSIFPVIYTGPEFNPNISMDEKRRRIRVLYPGEAGVAHCVDDRGTGYGDNRWCFRRLDGTRGYTVDARHLDFHKHQTPFTAAMRDKLRASQTNDAQQEKGSKRDAPLFVHEPLPLLEESE